ncbi:MAG: hypothetical protein KY466_01835 [Gemmatimonadetes bacterium]|nr:hypothetical protein [Gemmatimonadota bacterium]
MTQPTTSRWLLLLAAALVLPACSGDTTGTELDYDPAATGAQLEEVVRPLFDGENAFLGLSAAGAALGQFSAAQPAQELLRFRPGLDPRAGVEYRRVDRALWSAQVTFPAEIVGRTLVWDFAQERYVVDETRTDAPQDGVRLVHYTMNQGTRTPILPLEEIGFIDLVDEDVAEEERLGIRVVITTGAEDRTLLDYVVGFTGDSEPSEGSLLFTAVGALTSGTGRVDFDLTRGFTWSEAENAEELTLDYLYDAGAGLTVALQVRATSAFQAETWGDLEFLVEINDGADIVEVDALIAIDGSLSGEIRVNGIGVVDIAGSDGDAVFAHAGGGSLTPQDRNALRNLWNLIVRLLGLTEGLLSPAGILLLPG